MSARGLPNTTALVSSCLVRPTGVVFACSSFLCVVSLSWSASLRTRQSPRSVRLSLCYSYLVKVSLGLLLLGSADLMHAGVLVLRTHVFRNHVDFFITPHLTSPYHSTPSPVLHMRTPFVQHLLCCHSGNPPCARKRGRGRRRRNSRRRSRHIAGHVCRERLPGGWPRERASPAVGLPQVWGISGEEEERGGGKGSD